ncbi:hypothetical protein C8J57DRAFT_1728712 [Mycena rebaudengoi]|nr:hypothetical protein C8J57DRAFT_1728712 [Mycena rebaudengoi]
MEKKWVGVVGEEEDADADADRVENMQEEEEEDAQGRRGYTVVEARRVSGDGAEGVEEMWVENIVLEEARVKRGEGADRERVWCPRCRYSPLRPVAPACPCIRQNVRAGTRVGGGAIAFVYFHSVSSEWRAATSGSTRAKTIVPRRRCTLLSHIVHPSRSLVPPLTTLSPSFSTSANMCIHRTGVGRVVVVGAIARILLLSEPLQLLHHPLALTPAGLELRSWQLLALHDIDTHPPVFPALALFFVQLRVLEVKSQVSLTTAHSLRSSCEDSAVLVA